MSRLIQNRKAKEKSAILGTTATEKTRLASNRFRLPRLKANLSSSNGLRRYRGLARLV